MNRKAEAILLRLFCWALVKPYTEFLEQIGIFVNNLNSMNRFSFQAVVALTFTVLLASCGGEQKPAPGTEKQAETKSATSTEAKSEFLGNAERGKSLYTTCIACHGQNAEGMKSLGAPALADQEPYYLHRQIENFKTGVRGVHAEDVYGAQMAPMAKTLDSQGVKDVIAYIKSLPSPTVEKTMTEGDAKAGETYYNMICGACHAAGAVGIKSLNSPRLVGMQDWYLERQLNNFRKGIRGTSEGDIYGAQMQQIAVSIPDDKTVKDLVAYINSLSTE